MTEAETHTLDAPGAVLHYDVRRSDAGSEPVLLLIGSPMGAAGFSALAGQFTDRTVVTYDPRGAGRSKRTDGARQTTTEEQADDLHRLILALAACAAIHETYLREGFGPAMAKFIALVSLAGPIPAGFADQPGPDPARFGLPAADDGSRDDPLLGLNMLSTPSYRIDAEALLAAPTRIVIGVGAQSADMMTGRAATAVAGRLGMAPVIFPGGHDGFVGGEHGRTGKPAAFAATLRQVLTR